MIKKKNDADFREILPGISMKTLCYGDKTLMVEFQLSAGTALPGHSHPHEQNGYLVSGRLYLKVADEEVLVEAGDSWCIPSGVEHGARVERDSVAIEVFSPVREEYLP